jgi:hypothetical protein
MGMWDYFVSHMQLKNGADATIEDLLGEHKVHCCSLCGFTSAVKEGVRRHLQQCKKGQGSEWTVTMKAVLVPGIEGGGRDDQDEDDGLSEDIPEPREKMSVEQLNELGKQWLRSLTTKTRTAVILRHPTHAETQPITKIQELTCYVHQTINPLYLRFVKCDYEAKEGAMEYCWHLIRKKIRQLWQIREPDYGPKRALTPEQTAAKLMANAKADLEWDLLQTTDFVMEELNWGIIDNPLKDQTLSAHGALVLGIERGNHRDRLYKGITKLVNSVPEPIDEDKR